MKLLIKILIGIHLLGTVLHAENRNLERLTDLAVKNNKELRTSYYEYTAAQREITPAYIPPDPVLSYSLLNVPVNNFSFSQSPMSARQIAIQQRLPFPAKMVYAGKIKTREAEAKKYQYQLLKKEIILKISLLYYEIVQIKNNLNIEQEKQEKLALFEQIARNKYQVGKGLQQDILKAKVNLAQVQKKIILLSTSLQIKTEELYKLISQQYLPEDIKFIYDPLPVNDSILSNYSTEYFPAVELKDRLYHKAEYQNNLAKWEYLPDFILGAAYNFRDDSLPDKGVDSYSISIGIQLPLYFLFRQTPLVAAARKKEQSMKNDLENSREKVIEQFNIHVKMYQQSTQILNLFKKQIIPDARVSLDSALQAYQVDKVDFLNVLQSLVTLYSYYQEEQEALLELYRHKMYIEFYTSNTG